MLKQYGIARGLFRGDVFNDCIFGELWNSLPPALA
jgi:hypothetical protein